MSEEKNKDDKNVKTKSEKKKAKDFVEKHNPKAFSYSGGHISIKRKVQRSAIIEEKKAKFLAVNDKSSKENPPPIIIVVHGPPKCGKTTLIRSLVRYYCKQSVGRVDGPITVVASSTKRLTFIECNQNIGTTLDLAKIADLAILMIDARHGFQMDTFEFINLLKIHGFPRVMGVLSYLDTIKKVQALKKLKKKLKDRFWKELYDGAKLFNLTGVKSNRYLDREVINLSKFISVQKYDPLVWRSQHPYILGLSLEYDNLNDDVNKDKSQKCRVSIKGYVKGTIVRKMQNFTIPGCNDFQPVSIEVINDPCPLPIRKNVNSNDGAKNLRKLNDGQRFFYAPFSNIGDVEFEGESMYINIKDSKNDVELDNKSDQNIQEVYATDKFRKDESSDWDTSSESSNEILNQVQLDTVDEESISAETHFKIDAEKFSDVWEHNSDAESVSSLDSKKFKNFEFTKEILNDGIEAFQNKKFNYHKYVYGSEENFVEKNIFVDDVNKLLENDNNEMQDSNKASIVLGYDSLMIEMIDICDKKILTNRNISSELHDREKSTINHGKDTKVNDDENLVENDAENITENDTENITEDDAENITEDDAENITEDDAENITEDDAENITEDDEFSNSNNTSFDHEAKSETAHFCSIPGNMKLSLLFLKIVKNLFFISGTEAERSHKNDVISKKILNQQNLSEIIDDGEIIPVGSFIRVTIEDVDYNWLKNLFSDRGFEHPVILGGLNINEQTLTFLECKIKKHRWAPRILKSTEPLLFSIGWRRFQSIPYYAIDERNDVRKRFLKYTPEHMHCSSFIYGFTVPVGTGVVAMKNFDRNHVDWRISLSGSVLNIIPKPKVLKKLKLLGDVDRIVQNTAFIKNMFNSELEVNRCIGAKIMTQSKIRGIIKKAQGENGTFRATFEAKIQPNDTIICKLWVNVPMEPFCLPMEDISNWDHLRTFVEIRRDKELSISEFHKKDSAYVTKAQDPNFILPKLKIPKQIISNLPFKSIPKNQLPASIDVRNAVENTLKNPFEKTITSIIEKANFTRKQQIKKQQENLSHKHYVREKQDQKNLCYAKKQNPTGENQNKGTKRAIQISLERKKLRKRLKI